jgi:hypothetical protein
MATSTDALGGVASGTAAPALSAANTTATSTDPFDTLNKDLLLLALKALSATATTKPFRGKTYGKWETLNSDQKANVKKFWTEILNDAHRTAIINRIEREAQSITQENEKQQGATNYHDLCRLLHLRQDPKASVTWSRTLREATMEELDDTEGMEDPYSTLASYFNDYTGTVYQNTVASESTDISGCKVMKCNSSEYFPLMDLCKTVNPTSRNRPNRNGTWIRSKWLQIRNELDPVLSDFKKSGNQQAEHMVHEWVQFITQSKIGTAVHIFYAISLFSIHDLFRFSRRMDEEDQVNSSMSDTVMTPGEAIQKFKDAQTAKKSAARADQRKAKSDKDQKEAASGKEIAAVLDKRFEDANKREAEAFAHRKQMEKYDWLVKNGSKKQKLKARKRMAEELGISDDSSDDESY